MTTIFENFSNLAINLVGTYSYFGVFIGTAFFPSEIVMPLAGFAVSLGKMTLLGITVVAALGDVLGSLIVYFVGYKGGRPLLERYGKYMFISHSKLEAADRWFEKYGYEAVLISKLLPLIGRLISLPAGIARMNLRKFIIYTFIGSLLFEFILGYLGFNLGQNWYTIKEYFNTLNIIVIIGLIVILAYILYKKKYKNNKTSNTYRKPS